MNDSRPSSSNDITDPAKAKEFYNQAVKYSRLKMYSQATVAFQLAVQLKPNYADAHFGLGQAYVDTGRWEAAIDAFERGLRLDPNNKEAITKVLALYAKVRGRKKPASQESPNKANAKKVELSTQPTPKSSNQTPKTNVTGIKPPLTSRVSPGQNGGGSFNENTSASGSINSSLPNQKLSQPVTNSSKAAHANASANGVTERRDQNSNATKDVPKSQPGNVDGKQINQAQYSLAQQTASPPQIIKTVEMRASADVRSSPVSEKVAANVANSTDVGQPNLEPTRMYRAGVGDILEVRVRDAQVNQASLFTITATGLLEYPGLVQPLPVEGLTAQEIGQRLKSELMRLALSESPEVMVGVRDYASHTILISGQVKEPGTKVLRREAIPLYVVLADAQPLPEAERATVISNHSDKPSTIDLSDAAATGLLIKPGDVIMVQPALKQYFYIGGAVKIPGEKLFRQSLSLTQAVLMAGGVTHKPKDAEIELVREGSEGLLRSTRYKLKEINSGKLPDPLVQPGDRITVVP